MAGRDFLDWFSFLRTPIDAKRSQIWLQEGLNLSKQEDYEAAIKAFSDSIIAHRRNEQAYYNRAVALNLLGRPGEAIADLQKAAGLGHQKSREFLAHRNIMWSRVAIIGEIFVLPRLPAWVTVAGVLIVLFLAMSWFRSRPQYALFRLTDAVETRNRIRFEEHLDVDAFCESLIDEVFTGYLKSSLEDDSGSGFEALGALFGLKLAESMKPALQATVKTSLLGSVRAGSLLALLAQDSQTVLSEMLGMSVVDLARDYHLLPDYFKGLGDVQQEGERALIPLRFSHPRLETDLDFKLDLRKVSDDWRVVGVVDLAHYMTEVKRLRKVRVAETNEQIKGHILALVEIGEIKRAEVGRQYWRDDPKFLKFEFALRNLAADTVRKVGFHLRLPAAAGDGAYSLSVASMAPGEEKNVVRRLDYSGYDNWHREARKAEVSDFRLDPFILIRSVAGVADTLRPLRSWREYEKAFGKGELLD